MPLTTALIRIETRFCILCCEVKQLSGNISSPEHNRHTNQSHSPTDGKNSTSMHLSSSPPHSPPSLFTVVLSLFLTTNEPAHHEDVRPQCWQQPPFTFPSSSSTLIFFLPPILCHPRFSSHSSQLPYRASCQMPPLSITLLPRRGCESMCFCLWVLAHIGVPPSLRSQRLSNTEPLPAPIWRYRAGMGQRGTETEMDGWNGEMDTGWLTRRWSESRATDEWTESGRVSLSWF